MRLVKKRPLPLRLFLVYVIFMAGVTPFCLALEYFHPGKGLMVWKSFATFIPMIAIAAYIVLVTLCAIALVMINDDDD